ncbi:MAG TPA: nuclear transport factor 2 family protein [Acidimicrobiales bacterium]
MLLLRRFRRRKTVSDPVTVVSRFVDAANRHDADAIAKCLHPDFESIQPIYPSRNFRGSMQVKRNWQAIFESEPGFRLSLVRSASNDSTVWVELHGAGRDVEVAGVFIMGVEDELVRWARVYSAVVEQPAPKMAEHPDTVVAEEATSPQEEAEHLRRLMDAGRAVATAGAAASTDGEEAVASTDADWSAAAETDAAESDESDDAEGDEAEGDEDDDDEYEDDDDDEDEDEDGLGDDEDDEDDDDEEDDADGDEEDETVGDAEAASNEAAAEEADDELSDIDSFWQEGEVHDLLSASVGTGGDEDAKVVDLNSRMGDGDDHDGDDHSHGRSSRRRGGRRRR